MLMQFLRSELYTFEEMERKGNLWGNNRGFKDTDNILFLKLGDGFLKLCLYVIYTFGYMI